MNVKIEPSWKVALQSEFDKPYFEELVSFVKTEYTQKQVFPEPQNIFRALNLIPLNQVRVAILGQDPYHTPGVADGLAFSSKLGNKVPPSLQNIYKEIKDEFQIEKYNNQNNPDLTRWSNQGVLLLNTSLTVIKGQPASHSKIGWQNLTDRIISVLSQSESPIVFILWGSHARSKKSLIQSNSNHLVLESAHPSPFSVDKGFYGNNHFKLCNQFLEKNNLETITW